jgi:acetolactate synthase-1/2/3 large subunit
MLAQLQKLFNDHVYATKLTETPDFVKLADAYGLEGQRVEKIGELKETITNAFKSREATVIDVAIDQEELLPIVPPGQSLDNMKMTFDEE